MKAEEPIVAYGTTPSITHLRGEIINSIEQEQDIYVLQSIAAWIEQTQKKKSLNATRPSLRSLCGILKSNKTYEELRDEYLKDKYAL
ncbi:MAG: hypothetical protein IJV06_03010 [Bacteroidaceae bacterium]|nr:hypothetical protein [Bacteroidaceae bacterium]